MGKPKGQTDLAAKAEAVVRRVQSGLEAASGKISDRGAQGALARGIIFQNAAYLDEAIESFNEALRLDCEMHEASARLVVTLLRARRSAAALEAATALAASAPDYAMPELGADQKVGVFTILGNALLANGRTGEAVSAYEAALDRHSDDTTAAARLAQIHVVAGAPDKALKHADAVRRNPRFERLGNLLALGRNNKGLLAAFSSSPAIVEQTPDILGRPFMVDGKARIAAPSHDGDWCAEVPEVLIDA